ncbi:SMI1/KNR4 family protein [Kitasatospora sp. NPDC057904]|uniref:SMI1/KNR4 family protein n=1 Tax=Kitasatospora sp. NPDC057904 TaxID=3346275 RepID=UPI0036DDE3E1
MTRDASRVRTRLAAMADADPERRRFGSDHHDYRLRPPLAEETIRAFEHRHGVQLPSSYRSFLADVADGGAGPDYGVVGLTEVLDEEDAIHGVREDDLRPGVLAMPFTGHGPHPVAGSLVIAEGGCGMWSRLVVTGPNAGEVWHDDPDWGGLTPGPDFRDWYGAWLAPAEDT